MARADPTLKRVFLAHRRRPPTRGPPRGPRQNHLPRCALICPKSGLNQAELRATNAEYGIVTEAYGPLGVGRLLDNPAIATVAQAHGKTPAQVLIRWSIQLGNVVIPRSATPDRIKSNLDVFDFELTDDEMATLNGLDSGTRFRPNPDDYTGT
jgi:2,5-diketo-D-gluconate reductase A